MLAVLAERCAIPSIFFTSVRAAPALLARRFAAALLRTVFFCTSAVCTVASAASSAAVPECAWGWMDWTKFAAGGLAGVAVLGLLGMGLQVLGGYFFRENTSPEVRIPTPPDEFLELEALMQHHALLQQLVKDSRVELEALARKQAGK